MMATFVCALFTTFTGASGVTILALGGLLLPSLLEEGYPEDFSLGLVTAAGSLGLLFPPSLPVILYGVVAQAPIEHLFLGGLLPGLLMIVLVAAYGILVGVRREGAAPARSTRARRSRALWDAKWDLGLPTLVVVAVASGFATIVEAAALAAAYAIVVELAIFRSVHPLRDLPRVLVHAASLVGSVLILLGCALGVTSWFVDAEVPDDARRLDDRARAKPGALPAHAERRAARARKRARDVLRHRGDRAARRARSASPTASTRSTSASSSSRTSSSGSSSRRWG